MFGKKAALNLVDDWVDYVALFSLVGGLFLSFVAGSKVLAVLIDLLAGLIIGRWIYLRKYKHQLRFWYPLTGFIIGLIVGNRYLDYKGVIVSFVIGCVAGYYLKKNHLLD